MAASEAIILIVDDLRLLPTLESSLQHLDYRPLIATNEMTLTRAIGAAPVLAIIDLVSQTFDWKALILFIKGRDKKANHVPLLGFAPHLDEALREQALTSGCEAVVEREVIANQLPQLIEKYKWTVDRQRCQDRPPQLLIEGIALLNAKAFFECHEAIEDAWNVEKAPVRIMYQGILQIGVACHHIQRKNWRGAMKLLERGLPKIERFAPTCMGLDLAKLVVDAEAIRDELLRLSPQWQGEFDHTLFPTINLPPGSHISST